MPPKLLHEALIPEVPDFASLALLVPAGVSLLQEQEKIILTPKGFPFERLSHIIFCLGASNRANFSGATNTLNM